MTDEGGGEDDGGVITWRIGDLPGGAEGTSSYTFLLKEGRDNGEVIVSIGFIAGDLRERVTDNNRYFIQVAAKLGPEADAGPERPSPSVVLW